MRKVRERRRTTRAFAIRPRAAIENPFGLREAGKFESLLQINETPLRRVKFQLNLNFRRNQRRNLHETLITNYCHSISDILRRLKTISKELHPSIHRHEKLVLISTLESTAPQMRIYSDKSVFRLFCYGNNFT